MAYKNKDEENKYIKEWKERNKEHLKEYFREYKKKNPEKIKEIQARHRAKYLVAIRFRQREYAYNKRHKIKQNERRIN